RVRSVVFPENSDYADTLLRETEELVYPRQPNRFRGDLFLLEPLTGGPAVMLAKDAPAGKSHLRRPEFDLVTLREEASLYGTGADLSFFPAGEEIRFYGVTVGAGEKEALYRAYRKLMASRLKGEGDLVVMANTWGDRNCEKMLGDEFIRDELRAAERLGADVLTIDDGWNKGAIDDPDRYMEHIWEGYHAAAPDYWSVDKKRFPQGFAPAAKEAAERGVSLGLWFCPDPADDFSGWEKDAAILEDFYRRYGIRYFKLDGITFRSKRGERNLCKLYDRLCRDGFRLQLDITALDRFGCRYMPQYGIQFVENRSTDWGNYHPFRTLRNLWMLSRLLPARSLQFEVLNPRRRQDKYEGDPFAPAGYDMDYLFATVMVSNPLLWFELSRLDEADAAPLQKILGIWRKHSRALYSSEIVPVGEEPDGRSFTGFACLTDEKTGYLILFREKNEKSDTVFRLPLPAGGIETVLLASNGEGETGKEIGPGGSLGARFSREDQYLFLGYRLL
ncbi:MAG: alpha-galactosidase, partial [Clostridia bacterium]|nr:alpha-galactosidase [Clostridia bacterium]